MLLIILYIVANAIAFIVSLPVHRQGNYAYRVISTVMGMDLIIELWANILWLLYSRVHISNHPVYNFGLLGEFWLYAHYFSIILQSRAIRKIISVYLWALPAIWLLPVIFHINHWDAFFYVLGATFTIFLASMNYYQLISAPQLVKLSTSFEFWIATGLIFFYGVNFPYLGMLNFLNEYFSSLSHALLIILQVSNSMFYGIFTYAFLCTTRIRKSL